MDLTSRPWHHVTDTFLSVLGRINTTREPAACMARQVIPQTEVLKKLGRQSVLIHR